MTALARLTFYENLFIRQETTLSVLKGVHIKWVDLEKMKSHSAGTKKTVRYNLVFLEVLNAS